MIKGALIGLGAIVVMGVVILGWTTLAFEAGRAYGDWATAAVIFGPMVAFVVGLFTWAGHKEGW